MNAQGSDGLPGPWPDVLAAYADGELNPAARAAVERWLASHPAACRELAAQRGLSPANWLLWQQAEPTLPTDATWAQVRDRVSVEVFMPALPASRPERGWWKRAGVFFAGGVAAAIAAMILLGVLNSAFAPPPQQPVPTPWVREVVDQSPPADPLAQYAVLPLATDSDVDIRRVSGGAEGWLPVGEHPLSGPIALAAAEDVSLDGAEPHPAWPTGTPRMVKGPGDAPMIFAANPR